MRRWDRKGGIGHFEVAVVGSGGGGWAYGLRCGDGDDGGEDGGGFVDEGVAILEERWNWLCGSECDGWMDGWMCGVVELEMARAGLLLLSLLEDGFFRERWN